MANQKTPSETTPATSLSPSEIKAKLIAADDLRIERVDTPEWAEHGLPAVHVRNLTLLEAARLQELDDEGQSQRLAVAMGLCDASGVSLGFSDAEVELLGQKSVGPMRRLHDAIFDLSYLTASAVEDAAKNSPATASATSG